MTNRHNNHSDRLIIFTRYPVPGKTKTRLIPLIGSLGAADLQRRLTEKTLKTAHQAASVSSIGIDIHFEGSSQKKMKQWLGSGLNYEYQRKGNIGDRMFQSFDDVFKKGCRKAVLIGTDIPGLEAEHLRKAFNALERNDLVLGPSTDGGYWLIGLNRPVDIFKGIDWSTSSVHKQTLSAAKDQGLKTQLIDTLTDIDTAEDLRRWRPEESEKRPYISVIIPTFNEENNIERAIQSALDRDTEIIVADGDSNDDTVKKSSEMGAKVLMSPKGRGLQLNYGAKAADGRILLFLHADTMLPKGYINSVFDTFMYKKTVAGAFLFKTDIEHPLMKIFEFNANIRSRYLHLPYGDQGIFLQKTVFEAEGGFPETAIAEDLLLMRRLSKKGKIRIAPAYTVTSGRRWQKIGLLRTMFINQIIMTGCLLGISPDKLVQLYKIRKKR
ncbi:TIGR04283 family arsenosugar biosynthesis glycosyltransferase [Thermodesulfobacteriota bacterium]